MRLKLLLLLSLFYFDTNAQATTGFKIGGSIYTVNGIKGNCKSLPGYEAGLYSKGDLNDVLTFLAEADYSVKRSEISTEETSSTIELSYFTARFAAGVNLNERFYIALGPYFSYMINAKQSPELINKDFFTRFAVGLNPTIGYETVRFSFMLRYDWGLTFLTLESTPEAKNNALEGARFSGFQVIAGIKF